MLYVLDGGLYGRPDPRGAVVGDGDVRLAARVPPPGRATASFAGRMRRLLAGVFRDVGAVRPWRSGPLLMTPTRRPILGKTAGVWVLTGLGGDGLVLGPALGEDLAERLLAERT
jgi:glycine/D-amino acid oxidase-like deaminating enzyme